MTPIERAAAAMFDGWGPPGMFQYSPDSRRAGFLKDARAAFESIDPEAVANVMREQGWTCEYHEPDIECGQCRSLHLATATAVIAHLTGKDQT